MYSPKSTCQKGQPSSLWSSKESPSLLLLAAGSLGIPWLVAVYASLRFHHHTLSFLPCVFVPKFPSSHKDTSHWISSHSNPKWPHLNLIASAKTPFSNKVLFTGSRWTYILGNSIQASTPWLQGHASFLDPSGNQGFSHDLPLGLFRKQQHSWEQPIALHEIV